MRMSGINIDQCMICKGLVDVICCYVEVNGGYFFVDVDKQVEEVVCQGVMLLVVVEGEKVLGIIVFKDIVKGGIKECFVQLCKMGIKMVMIIGDNCLIVVVIVVEVGVDDFFVEVMLEVKLVLICQYQLEGWLVVMIGDGINDVFVLVQVDVVVVMNFGIQVVKEVGNMVDLDFNFIKLIEVVYIGKQMLMMCGLLIIFSIVNDVVKYFVIILVVFVVVYFQLVMLNVMGLYLFLLVIFSVVIFNVLIIVFLILLVLKGVSYCLFFVLVMLCCNLWIYGFGGLLVFFIGIKVIDLLLILSGLV